MSAEWDDLARHAEAIPPGARDWYVGPGLDEVYVGGGSGSDPCVAEVLGSRQMAWFIAAANPATILRLISERDTLAKAVQLTAEAATARLAEVEAERDVLAARLAAVKAAIDRADPPGQMKAGTPSVSAPVLRAALSAAPTDTTKETDRE